MDQVILDLLLGEWFLASSSGWGEKGSDPAEVMVSISIPQEAFAFPVYVHNSYSQPMSVATLNFEDNENESIVAAGSI